MRLLRDLWATSARHTALVAVLIVVGAVAGSSSAALTGQVLIHRSGAVFAVLATCLATAALSDLLVGLVAARLTAEWTADVRRRLCRIAFGQDLQSLETTPVGELLDRIDGDVNDVGGELRSSGVRIVQILATGIASIFTAFVVWWPAGVLFVLLAGILARTIREPVSRLTPAREYEEESWSDLAAVVEEAIHGQDDVRTTLGRPYVMRMHARRCAEVLRRGRLAWVIGAKVSLIASMVTRGGIAIVVAGGAWALHQGHIDAARLTAVWLLALAFGGTVENASRMIAELQNALGAWSRVVLLMGTPQEPDGGDLPHDGDIDIRGLTFTYPAAQQGRPVLSDVTLTLRRGRSYALIGRTGSGKTTLAKILTRSVDVPRGTVFLGELDLVDLDIEALRRWVAVVPQRTEILAGTLVENVALFDPALMPAAEQALNELGLADWIADLPDGAQTRLGDGGYTLSAGQEQLVAFARILVRDPHIVILDEATARMDPVTEARVHDATARLLEGRIGVVIAHRLSSVRRCDEVVVLADGRVVESGPLETSQRFADLLAASGLDDSDSESAADAAADTVDAAGAGRPADPSAPASLDVGVALDRTDPPPLPEPPPVRTLREIARLTFNDLKYGQFAMLLFTLISVLGLDGAVLPWLWAALVDGGDITMPALGIVLALLVTVPLPYWTSRLFPEWWVRQVLRIGSRLVHGQTGPRRVSAHTPAEVVAQGADCDRVVSLADNVADQGLSLVIITVTTIVTRSFVPAAFFLGTMIVSGLAATLFAPPLHRRAEATVMARAAFATALVSSLSAARSVKLAGARDAVLAHLARLDTVRSRRQAREIQIQVWARSTPSLSSGLLPIAVWGLYLAGGISGGAALVAVSILGSARWFAWTTASLVSSLPSARVWTRRTVEMCGAASYSAVVPGVDLSAGTAPAPTPAPRTPLRRLELARFTAVHTDGTVGVTDIDLEVARGELVLVVGPVGSGKSSLLRALAGIVHHTGDLRWNGQPVDEPDVFLRPNQVGYVGQVPRVLSGTVAENISLGHDVDADAAVAVAQLDYDLADVGVVREPVAVGVAGAGAPDPDDAQDARGVRVATTERNAEGQAGAGLPSAGIDRLEPPDAGRGRGLDLLIGHKGTRLSGGQLQRLALARALAPQTELLVADDVSSALDVTTELDLWRALRENGITVVGSTSKRAALAQADRVVVLVGGRAVAQGTWEQLEDEWGHLAG